MSQVQLAIMQNMLGSQPQQGTRLALVIVSLLRKEATTSDDRIKSSIGATTYMSYSPRTAEGSGAQLRIKQKKGVAKTGHCQLHLQLHVIWRFPSTGDKERLHHGIHNRDN
jgi:hypothetical protein